TGRPATPAHLRPFRHLFLILKLASTMRTKRYHPERGESTEKKGGGGPYNRSRRAIHRRDGRRLQVSIGVLLGGCGHYDGSDVHEAVFLLLALESAGERPVLIAPDRPQERTVEHLGGDEVTEERNVLRESAPLAQDVPLLGHLVASQVLD